MKLTVGQEYILKEAIGIINEFLCKPNEEGNLLDDLICNQLSPSLLTYSKKSFCREELTSVVYVLGKIAFASELEIKYKEEDDA